MTLAEAFEIGWIAGSVMNFQHPRNQASDKGYDFQEGLRRFEKITKTSALSVTELSKSELRRA